MEAIELNHQSSVKNNNMNSSNNSTNSTTSIKIEDQTKMIIHEEIEEVLQEDEMFDKLQDEIDMLELKLKKDLTPQEKENLMFQQVKCKCQAGVFCGEKTSYKSCRKVRQDMENSMGEFSAKYCFIVFTGIETNGNIFIIPTLINSQKYFKVSYSTYNFICYEVSLESNIICNSLKLSGSNTSIPNEESVLSSNSSIVLQAINNVNQKGGPSNNMTMSKNYMSCSNPKSVQNNNFMSSSLGSNSSVRKNSLNFQQKKDNLQKRSSTLYLQQQIINDENRLKKQLQKQEKYKSSLVHNDDIPSREEMLKIAKSYTKYIGKENLRKPFTCKEYAEAIWKAFQNKGVYPKMVIVKREPQGDFFWDYSCENEVTLHTWDMFKNQERGVAVVV